jgi:hypothetical protein
MRAFLGAAAVDVEVRFAGDLLHVAEVTVADRVGYRVGLSPDAHLPLLLPPVELVRSVDGRLELCVPWGMVARAGGRRLSDGESVATNASVRLSWAAVEIDVVPAAPMPAHAMKRRRALPLELLTGSVASVVGLAALFPVGLLMLVIGGRAPSLPLLHADDTHIVYRWNVPAAATGADSASPPTRQTAPATTAPAEAADSQIGQEAEAPRAERRNRAGREETAAAARQAASRAGIFSIFSGRVQLGADHEQSVSSLVDSALGGSRGGGNATGERAASDGAGSLAGSEVGETSDGGGLGLSGFGEGGSGTGEGTIGLGNLGTIGHGGGTGTGYGYGSGSGLLGGRRASLPDVVVGSAQVRGALDKDLIRRVVRRHLNEVRYCYELELLRDPELRGRVETRFFILPDGTVASAATESSTFADPAIGRCTAQAFRRWQFPRVPDGGLVEVKYPFDFFPAGGT